MFDNNDNDDDESNELIVKDHFANVDDCIDALGFGRYQWRIFILTGLGVCCEAGETAFHGILFPILKEHWKLSNVHISMLASASLIGMLFGALILGSWADSYGRQMVFQLSLFISSLFGMLSAFSTNIYMFAALRLMVGFGYGGNIVVDTVLLAENIPVRRRGVWMALLSGFWGLGSILLVLCSWYVIPRYGWQRMVFFSAIPAFIMIALRRNTPESPRFLLMHGDVDGARSVLMAIAHENGSSPEIQDKIRRSDLRRIEREDSDALGLSTYSRLYTHRALGFVTQLLSVIWFFDSLSSVLFVWLPMYLAENKQLADNTHAPALHGSTLHMRKAYMAALSDAIGNVVGTLLMSASIYRIDRRVFLYVGLLALTMITLTLGFLHHAMMIISLMPFIAAVRVVVINLLYIITPELYPTAVRTTALGLMSALHRAAPMLGHWLIGFGIKHHFLYVVYGASLSYFVAYIAASMLPHDGRNRVLASFFYDTVKDQSSSFTKHSDDDDDNNDVIA